MSGRRHRKRKPSKRLARIFERHGGRCYYCRRITTLHYADKPSAATVDHVVPQAEGGRDAHWNLVLACRDCNGARGAMEFESFRRLVRRLKLKTDTEWTSEILRNGRPNDEHLTLCNPEILHNSAEPPSKPLISGPNDGPQTCAPLHGLQSVFEEKQ